MEAFPQPQGVGPIRSSPRSVVSPVLLLGAMICISAPGCEHTHQAKILAETVLIQDVIDWVREIRLEESDEVINVLPMVSLDPRGGLLVADAQEVQLRRYAPSGKLIWTAGRKGSAPGEFRYPNVIARLRSGEVLAADFSHRLTLFDSTATQVVETIETPFRRIEDLEILNDSLLLVGAIVNDDLNAPLLHVWNIRSNAVVRSFGHTPFTQTRNQTAPHLASWGKASLRGDTLAAIFPLNDTIYFFTIDGSRVDAKHLPSRHFRRAPSKTPTTAVSAMDQGKWLGTFDYVHDVHWLASGDLLVMYMSLRPERALERQWHLLRMRRDGTGVFEIRDAPRLLAVDRENNDELYFVAPRAEAPNQWITGRFF